MSGALVFVQVLNGLQFGVLLFLIAAGLTLVFGVMNFINLAHGVQYMLGAYLAVTFYLMTASFLLAMVLALLAALAFGLLLELTVFRRLYDRDHLDHRGPRLRQRQPLGSDAPGGAHRRAPHLGGTAKVATQELTALNPHG